MFHVKKFFETYFRPASTFEIEPGTLTKAVAKRDPVFFAKGFDRPLMLPAQFGQNIDTKEENQMKEAMEAMKSQKKRLNGKNFTHNKSGGRQNRPLRTTPENNTTTPFPRSSPPSMPKRDKVSNMIIFSWK